MSVVLFWPPDKNDPNIPGEKYSGKTWIAFSGTRLSYFSQSLTNNRNETTSMKHIYSHTHIFLTKNPWDQTPPGKLLEQTSRLWQKIPANLVAAAGNFAKVDPRVDELCKYLMTLSCGSYADNATWMIPDIHLFEGGGEVGWLVGWGFNPWKSKLEHTNKKLSLRWCMNQGFRTTKRQSPIFGLPGYLL